MKKLFLFLSLFLCTIYAETEPIIIIHNIPSLPTKISQITISATEEIIQPQDEIQEEPSPVFTSPSKKLFTYERMNCTLELPTSWEMDTSSDNYRLISYPYHDNRLVVTLRCYQATEAISAYTVYLYRSSAVWERWQLLGTKTFNPKECFLVGVSEKISAVYKRQEINEQLTMLSTIVAEDVYVKSPDLVYIVTAQAPEDIMKKNNQLIKEIMNSFYVSEVINGKKL